MSTKIYNGFRLAANVDPFGFSRDWRDALLPVRKRIDAELLINRAVCAIDAADCAGEPRPAHALAREAASYRREQSTLKRHDLDRDPHRFEVSLGRDPETSTIVGIYYGEHDELVDAFLALDGVSPFGYWNNADSPDDVDDEEWSERSEIWDRVLGWDAPAEVMLSAVLRASPVILTSEREILAAHGDTVERALADREGRARLMLASAASRVAARCTGEGGGVEAAQRVVGAVLGLKIQASEVNALALALGALAPADLASDQSRAVVLPDAARAAIAAAEQRVSTALEAALAPGGVRPESRAKT